MEEQALGPTGCSAHLSLLGCVLPGDWQKRMGKVLCLQSSRKCTAGLLMTAAGLLPSSRPISGLDRPGPH